MKRIKKGTSRILNEDHEEKTRTLSILNAKIKKKNAIIFKL